LSSGPDSLMTRLADLAIDDSGVSELGQGYLLVRPMTSDECVRALGA
jgi:hypothetical protein